MIASTACMIEIASEAGSLTDWISAVSQITTVGLLMLTAMISWWAVKEMRRQNRGVLVVNCSDVEPPSQSQEDVSVSVPEIAKLHESWHRLLASQYRGALKQKRYLRLRLTNDGASRITTWSIKGSVNVEAGEHLSKHLDGAVSKNATASWSVKCEGRPELQIPPQRSITIILGNIEAFPIANFSWKIEYCDSRGHGSPADFDDGKFGIENALLKVGPLPDFPPEAMEPEAVMNGDEM